MSEELKPCPFCGGEAEFDWGSVVDLGSKSHQYGDVSCKDCEACFSVESVDDNMSDEDLISLWNTRTLTPKQQHADDMYKMLAYLIANNRLVYGEDDDAANELLSKVRGES